MIEKIGSLFKKIKSFRFDTIHDMRISYCSETQVMTIMHWDEWTVKLTALNEHTKKVIYTIHRLLFEVTQSRRTISEHEKKIECLIEEIEDLRKLLAEKENTIENIEKWAEERNRKMDVQNENLRNELDRERQRTKPVLSEWAEEIAKTNHIKLRRLEMRLDRLLNTRKRERTGEILERVGEIISKRVEERNRKMDVQIENLRNELERGRLKTRLDRWLNQFEKLKKGQ